jgi:hypothetical protein
MVERRGRVIFHCDVHRCYRNYLNDVSYAANRAANVKSYPSKRGAPRYKVRAAADVQFL